MTIIPFFLLTVGAINAFESITFFCASVSAFIISVCCFIKTESAWQESLFKISIFTEFLVVALRRLDICPDW